MKIITRCFCFAVKLIGLKFSSQVFTDIEKKVSPTYVDNARAQLMKDLPYHLKKDVDNELRKHNYHYLPTLRALQVCAFANLYKFSSLAKQYSFYKGIRLGSRKFHLVQ